MANFLFHQQIVRAPLIDNHIDNHIDNNVGLLMGGGVAISGSQTTLGENTIAGNVSGIGGGLYLQNNESTLTNTLIVENQASIAGSGLYGYATLARLLHTTLARNRGGDGSGIHLSHLGGSASAILTNTILVSHSVGVTVAAGSSAQLAATLWGSGTWANAVDWGGAGTITTGTLNIRQEPGFISPQTGNYHLRYGSAALDQGINAGVNQDIDGEARPYDGGYDLGADEGRPSLAIVKTSENPAWPGQPLTYTLHLTNTGYISLTPIITDILPTYVSPTGTLSWTPSLIAPGDTWMQQVVVTVAPDYTGPLTNVVQATSDQDAVGIYTHTLTTGHRYYFPLIFKDG